MPPQSEREAPASAAPEGLHSQQTHRPLKSASGKRSNSTPCRHPARRFRRSRIVTKVRRRAAVGCHAETLRRHGGCRSASTA
jgi:hypothetical protein